MNRTALPQVVSREAWLSARKALLEKEKAITHQRDAVNAERRRLPMVKIDKDYSFEGPSGKLRLADMFEGRRQLYIHHFMWIDATNTGCPSCSLAADLNFTPLDIEQLQQRDITFACISRVPFADIQRYKLERGWTFPWYSSYGSDFNYDFHVTLDPARGPIEYNYCDRDQLHAAGLGDDMLKGDFPANSVFLRDGKAVYHTYTAYARGLDQLATPYNFLDLTVYGRQEAWEDSPAGWPQKPTYG